MRKWLEITNRRHWLVRFINPIGDTLAPIWSLSPFSTDEKWNTIDCCQFKRIIRLWSVEIWNLIQKFPLQDPRLFIQYKCMNQFVSYSMIPYHWNKSYELDLTHICDIQKLFIKTYILGSLNAVNLLVNRLCNTRQFGIFLEISSNENIDHLRLTLRSSVLFWNNHKQSLDQMWNRITQIHSEGLLENTYSRTRNIDTFYEISRNIKKIRVGCSHRVSMIRYHVTVTKVV